MRLKVRPRWWLTREPSKKWASSQCWATISMRAKLPATPRIGFPATSWSWRCGCDRASDQIPSVTPQAHKEFEFQSINLRGVVGQFDKEASQTRDYCVAKTARRRANACSGQAQERAARLDPLLRRKRLFRMTIRLTH